MVRHTLLIFALLLFGCGSERDQTRPEFVDVYKRLQDLPWATEPPPVGRSQRVSMSVRGMDIHSFVREIYDQTGVTIICGEQLDEKEVSLDAEDQPIDSLLAMVARRFDVSLNGQDRLFFMGTAQRQDKSFLVRRVSRLPPEDVTRAIQILLSDVGSVQVFDSGVMVVADRAGVLARVWELVERLEDAPAHSWVVQLYVVALSERDSRRLGIDVGHLVDVSANVALANTGDFKMDLTNKDAPELLAGQLALQGTLIAAAESSQSSLVAQPLVVLLDGQTSSITEGTRIPIPRRTVSDAGTVTVTGYDFVQTGLQVTLGVRDVAPSIGRLDVAVALDSLSGFVVEAPITQRVSTQTSAYLRSGGVYLLAALNRQSDQAGSSGPGFATVWDSSSDSGTIQVWARAFKIGGPSQVDQVKPE